MNPTAKLNSAIMPACLLIITRGSHSLILNPKLFYYTAATHYMDIQTL